MITRHCFPGTSLPLALYPFPLWPHGISCQLGSFPPLLAVPITQHRSWHQQCHCPPIQVRLAAAGGNEGERARKTLSAPPTQRWRLRCHPGEDDSVQRCCERWKGALQHFLWVPFSATLSWAALVQWQQCPHTCHPTPNDKGRVAKKTDKSWRETAETKCGITLKATPLEWKVQQAPLYLYSLCWNPGGPHILRVN